MKRDERGFEPFLALALVLMLVESWFHAAPGHDPAALLRRLLPAARTAASPAAEAEDADNPAIAASGPESQGGAREPLSDAVGKAVHPWRLEMPTVASRAFQRNAPAAASAAAAGAATRSSPAGTSAGALAGVAQARPSGGSRAPSTRERADDDVVRRPTRTPQLLRRAYEEPDWDSSRRGVRPGGGASSSPRAAAAKTPNARAHDAQGRPVRPPDPRIYLRLQDLLGPGALKPPSGRLEPPDFAALLRRKSDPAPGVAWAGAREIESLKPPDSDRSYRDWLATDGRGGEFHSHDAGDVRYLHATPLWEVLRGGRRAPMAETDKRWWTLAAGEQPLVRHQEHWWWRAGGTWFLLHEGQPWAYRWFGEWRQEGLLDTKTGARIVYSADGSKALVSVPGQPAVLFDLETGEPVGPPLKGR